MLRRPCCKPVMLTLIWLLVLLNHASALSSNRVLNCPTGPGHPWEIFLENVEAGWTFIQQGQMHQASEVLADAIGYVTRDLSIAHECSLGLAAAYRVLALAHVVDPQLLGKARRRGLQVGLRFMNLASNWLTHTFVKHNAEVSHIDDSAWPITLQESADEHRFVMAALSEGGQQAGHRAADVTVSPFFRHPGLSIAIVSLCAYPDGHVLPRYAMSNHQIYAERHGYTYHVSTELDGSGRPPAWGKVRLMHKYVKQRKWDWVMWADCDTYFMNLSITLDSILFRYGSVQASSGVPPEDAILDPAFHFLVTEDHAMLNTGVFLARSSDWSEAMLDRIWGGDESAWANHPWWEQAAMCWDFWADLPQKFRNEDHNAWVKGVGENHDEMDGIYPAPVRVAPQIEFNSYHPVTSRMLADTWSSGKFVIAFNGVVSSSSPHVARELYGRYYETFCELNQVQHLCVQVRNFLPWLPNAEPWHGSGKLSD